MRIEKRFAIEAEKRMKAGIKVEDDPTKKVSEGSKGEAAEKAAATVNTNQQYVKYAKKLEKDAPDLLETWEAASNYLGILKYPEVQILEIAKLLGLFQVANLHLEKPQTLKLAAFIFC